MSSWLPIILKNLTRFSGTLETSGATLQTESGEITLPKSTTVSIMPTGGRLVVDFGTPARAARRFLGLKFSSDMNPLFVGEQGIQATVGGMKVTLFAIPEEMQAYGDAYGATLRSPHWPAVRDAFIAEHPTCAACGSDDPDFAQVHHVVPFSQDSSLELVTSNLIHLCQHPARPCHYVFGHLGKGWSAWNKNVRSDAARHLDAIREWEARAA